MEMKYYGNRMLMKQLKYAEAKGQEKYSADLKVELVRRGVMKPEKEMKKPPAKKSEKKS